MTTARDICIDALKECGSLGVGQTPLPEDINDAFTRMQRMVSVWQKNRWLVNALTDLSFIGNGSKSYTVGLGGTINIKPPSDVKGAYVIQRNTGSTPISLPLKKIFSYEDYIRITVKDLSSLPDHFFYDNKFPLANLFIWPVANASYEIHFIIPNQLGFGSTINVGSITTGGTGGVDGNYTNVELTGGAGSGATADITVNGGAVTVVNLLTGGQDFAIGNILSAASADIGGVTGFTYTVDDITSTVDSEIIMPEEYEEALMYNLAIRLCSMYQVEPMSGTQRLARASLNNIRKNNTQVPALIMPQAPGVRTGKAFNIYNADGY